MVSVVNQDDVAKDDFCPKVKLFHIFMPVMREKDSRMLPAKVPALRKRAYLPDDTSATLVAPQDPSPPILNATLLLKFPVKVRVSEI